MSPNAGLVAFVCYNGSIWRCERRKPGKKIVIVLFFPSKDADRDNGVYRLEGYFHGIFHELVDICLNHEWRLTYDGGEQAYRDTKKSSCA